MPFDIEVLFETVEHGLKGSRKDLRMHAFLETDRLLLRQFTAKDVDHLVELDSDPEVMRFVPEAAGTTRHEIETDSLLAYLDHYQWYAGYGFWAAIEKSDGQFLGWFHLRPRDRSRPNEVELGFRLRQSAWGKGYGTEGSRALIRKGFTQLGMQRVVAEAMTTTMITPLVLMGLAKLELYSLSGGMEVHTPIA